MRAGNGAAFTALVDKHPVTGELRVKKRPVTPPEIAELQAKGVTLAFLPDPDEANTPKSESLTDETKQGRPMPSVPSSFTIMRSDGYTYGGFWTNATRPQGKTTHWSNFNLRSTGFSGTIEHVAHSLIFNGTDPMVQGLKGNGLAIGKLAGYPGPSGVGCGPVTNPGYYAEVEAWWHDGNWLYPSTCTPTGKLYDGPSNNFSLHVNINQWVAYWIIRNGETIFTSQPVDTTARRPYWDPNQGGVLFTVTGGDGEWHYPDYTLRFTNVTTGWF
ncbi:MAG: hypothetical protein HYZ17_17605 [Betaproteobacteria bacterium]|nr:hypothetical protein [Betaproteobacteria bacterium]CAG0953882.1 hypothetical protein BURK2_00351 [Burkholderiales bacterium]